MATKTIHFLSPANFLFLTTMFLYLFPLTLQDNPCPYPCYPPPTAPGSTPGTGTVTPPPPASLSPPSPSGTIYPTPTGNLPYNPPPPYDNNYLYGHPPPDPILPYFPFYYRKPPHKTDESSATCLGKSTALIITASFLVLVHLATCSSLG